MGLDTSVIMAKPTCNRKERINKDVMIVQTQHSPSIQFQLFIVFNTQIITCM